MSTRYYLVSLKTMQAVSVATSGGAGVRGPDNGDVVGLFCKVYDHISDAVLMHDGELERRDLCHDELTYWTAENAAERYVALTGEQPPDWQ